LDLDGNTKLKSKAGHYGNDSSIVSNAAQFADRRLQAEKLNKFYKKRCQEKSSASTGRPRLFLEIQPTLFRYPEVRLSAPFS
jgi:hypothetical protein